MSKKWLDFSDNRFFLLLSIASVFLLMLYSEHYLGSYQIQARNLGFAFWAMPYFIDLRQWLCAIDNVRASIDPYSNQCMENGITNAPFNYPLAITWLSFIKVLNVKNHYCPVK